MARYYGAIGYGITHETVPGVWEETITERNYYGDVIKNTKIAQTTSNLNDDIKLSNKISIVADGFAYNNYANIKYATYMGVKWKVDAVDLDRPRLVLVLGGVYNA